MPRNSEMQGAFAAAVRNAGHALPEGVTSHSTEVPARRFNVYRNNFYASLIDVLAGRYPVVARLVGDDFFRAMARVYVEQEPPRSAMILAYGGGFADFLGRFPPVADVPYLSDIARLEWARHTAYHAADAAPLHAGDFAAIPDDQVAVLRLQLHPAVSVVSSLFPIVSTWQTNAFDEQVRPVGPDASAEDALVTRPDMTVEVRRIPPGAAAFVGALQDGRMLGEAAECGFQVADTFDLAGNIAGLIDAGAITGYQT